MRYSNTNKVKVGSRVEAICDIEGRPKKGDRGTVYSNESTTGWLRVEWDRDVGGHEGDGRRRIGHCWNVEEKNVRFITKREEDWDI